MIISRRIMSTEISMKSERGFPMMLGGQGVTESVVYPFPYKCDQNGIFAPVLLSRKRDRIESRWYVTENHVIVRGPILAIF